MVKKITDWDEYTGRLAAVDAVEVRARVSSYLQSVHFEEGAIVERGDLLFVIDPRPYRAALDRAEAQADQAAARLELAHDERARAERLFESHAVSEQDLDTRIESERAAAAQLAAAQAAIQSAELDICGARSKAGAPAVGR